jgi:hypothetical protein
MFSLEQIVLSVVLAVLGGMGYVFFWRLYENVKEAARHLVLAAIAGVIYAILRSEHGFPDLIVTMIVGWWAPDFLSGLAERMKPKKEKPPPSS